MLTRLSAALLSILYFSGCLIPIPTNSKILFTSNRDTNGPRHEIYAMDEEGGNVTRITFSDYHHFLFGIDRSSRYIVATRGEEDTNGDGQFGPGDHRTLWLFDMQTLEETQLVDPIHYAESRSFSPDSEWVVLCMVADGAPSTDLYKVRRNGEDLTRLTFTDDAHECDASWSPDGQNKRLLYDGGPGPGIEGVFAPGAYDPAWSPDGKWVVFERMVEDTGGNFGSGNWHILQVNVSNPSNVVNLSKKGGHTDWAEYLPSYSPDNLDIVFGAIHEDELNPEESFVDIFKMTTSGAPVVKLTSGVGTITNMGPQWIY
jgi:Tol biopolymer transport system component